MEINLPLGIVNLQKNPTCFQWKQLIRKVSDICERAEGIEEIKTPLNQISKELGEFKSKFEALE